MAALFGPDARRPPGHRLHDDHRSPPFRLVDALPPSLEYLCLYGYVRGLSVDVDAQVDELMARRAARLPRLAEIRGVDETVEDLAARYGGGEPSEETLWQRPEIDLDWVRA